MRFHLRLSCPVYTHVCVYVAGNCAKSRKRTLRDRVYLVLDCDAERASIRRQLLIESIDDATKAFPFLVKVRRRVAKANLEQVKRARLIKKLTNNADARSDKNLQIEF